MASPTRRSYYAQAGQQGTVERAGASIHRLTPSPRTPPRTPAPKQKDTLQTILAERTREHLQELKKVERQHKAAAEQAIARKESQHLSAMKRLENETQAKELQQNRLIKQAAQERHELEQTIQQQNTTMKNRIKEQKQSINFRRYEDR